VLRILGLNRRLELLWLLISGGMALVAAQSRIQ